MSGLEWINPETCIRGREAAGRLATTTGTTPCCLASEATPAPRGSTLDVPGVARGTRGTSLRGEELGNHFPGEGEEGESVGRQA